MPDDSGNMPDARMPSRLLLKFSMDNTSVELNLTVNNHIHCMVPVVLGDDDVLRPWGEQYKEVWSQTGPGESSTGRYVTNTGPGENSTGRHVTYTGPQENSTGRYGTNIGPGDQ